MSHSCGSRSAAAAGHEAADVCQPVIAERVAVSVRAATREPHHIGASPCQLTLPDEVTLGVRHPVEEMGDAPVIRGGAVGWDAADDLGVDSDFGERVDGVQAVVLWQGPGGPSSVSDSSHARAR
jgi:hypothetical protein